MTTQSSQDERDERKAWEVFEQARKNEGPSAQRKHHLVPASYLRRWQQGGQIRVTELGIKSYKTSPEKAARETDFYRLEHPEVDPEHLPPLLFETLLGKLEGSAKLAIDVLLEQQPGALDDEIMQEFAWHLSFQFVRGYTFREENRNQLASMYRLQYANVSDEQIRIYDAYAGAFSIIHNNIAAALEATNITGETGTLNRQAKSAARSAFESAKQRFFNHLITAMKTPSLIAAIDHDLAAGYASVI